MTAPTLQVRPFSPLDALYCELRRRLPQIIAAHVHEPEEYIRVTYRDRGPADLIWDPDAQEYRWATGPDQTRRVGTRDDIEETARNIASYLGAGPGRLPLTQ
ncbi:hypothetical protein [Actinomadura formosensis]|uniref:hypothetical protein n=1 Tax=Actinomadura formosensis TaxID=60706 RepID=UPI003D947D6B